MAAANSTDISRSPESGVPEDETPLARGRLDGALRRIVRRVLVDVAFRQVTAVSRCLSVTYAELDVDVHGIPAQLLAQPRVVEVGPQAVRDHPGAVDPR